VLVFDLGGGTFDVTVFVIDDGVFDVKATHGDSQLGGDDWDQAVIDWLLQAVHADCGKAKIDLSSMERTRIQPLYITTTPDGPVHLDDELTRSLLEQLCDHLRRLMPSDAERPGRRPGRSRDTCARCPATSQVLGGEDSNPQ
jgi:molecular chaperone DnaK